MGEFVEPGIDRRSRSVNDTALVTEDAGLHIVEVILPRLLESGVVTLLLELLGLEVVTGVELIADGQRDNVQFFQIATHGQHLQHRFLCPVVGVLRPTLALGNPDVFLLLGHGEVDVTAHEL